MIQQKIKIIDNIEYKLTSSDCGKKILQKETGIIYDDALDTVDSTWTYEETDLEIDK